MRRHRNSTESTESVVRSGLTLLELVVCVAIVLVLLALFLPTARIGRDAARRTQCLNNEKNIALAHLNSAHIRSGWLPAQGLYPSVAVSEDGAVAIFEGRSWVVEVLPHLDRNDISDRWNISSAWDDGTADGEDSQITNRTLSETFMQVLTCPDDESAWQQPGGLSYVVNCGVGDRDFAAFSRHDMADRSDLGHACEIEPFDWDGDGMLPPDDPDDVAVTRDMGVFWPEFGFFDDNHDGGGGVRRSHGSVNTKDIYDGSGNTILMTENINAGTSDARKFNSWANPQLANCGFLLPVTAAAVGPLAGGDGMEKLIDMSVGNPHVNAMNDVPHEGRAPFPNSNHPGIVVVSFCDGRVTSLSDDIDPSVYARLLTPGGTRPHAIPAFVPELTLSETDF